LAIGILPLETWKSTAAAPTPISGGALDRRTGLALAVQPVAGRTTDCEQGPATRYLLAVPSVGGDLLRGSERVVRTAQHEEREQQEQHLCSRMPSSRSQEAHGVPLG